MATQTSNTPHLANRALLVSVNIRQWNGRRLDKAETEAVIAKHGAAKKAARVNKDLLPKAVSLQALHKYAGDIRTFVYKNTLAWSDGVRILRSEGYLDFTQAMSQHKHKWEQLVSTFEGEYPQLVREAQASLGTLFNSADYPDVSTIADRFGIEIKFMPVPTAQDWRVELGDDQIRTLQADIEQQVRASQATAMREAFERIYDVAQKAHARLSDPKAIFRDSLVENAVELCEILPKLNISGDKKIDELTRKLRSTLGAQDPKVLRKDSKARANTAAEMSKIMARMGAFMGPVTQ